MAASLTLQEALNLSLFNLEFELCVIEFWFDRSFIRSLVYCDEDIENNYDE
jgi:hypothetical protein